MKKPYSGRNAEPQRERPRPSVFYIEEPELIFGQQQQDTDPKRGMFDFGPYSVGDGARHPACIRVGIVGSGETIADTQKWLSRVQGKIEPVSLVRKRTAPFPGVNVESPFRTIFAVDQACVRQITELEIKVVVETSDRRRAFEMGLDLLSRPIQIIAQEHHPHVILVAIPQQLHDACRAIGGPNDKSSQVQLTPAERTLLRLAKKQSHSSQGVLFADMYKVAASDELAYRNFRRALKARVMRWGVPIQIMLQRSFYDESDQESLKDKIRSLKRRSLQEPATRAWNFCSAMYFKANGVPWRLAGVAQGTCFVGVSFFRHDTIASPHMHASLGQVFTDQGDALVVLGDRFEWDVAKQGSPHLTRDHAHQLLGKVLKMYDDHVKGAPTRLVLHKSSRFSQDEKEGFLDAIQAAKVSRYDFVTLYPRGIRLFRAGTYPPARGTVVEIPQGGALLYTMGYIPALDTYPKGHVPKPLEIVERYGDSDFRTVCSEILGLTKLNWNSADYASSDPITLRFSRTVADVLRELPDGEQPHPHYRFYI